MDQKYGLIFVGAGPSDSHRDGSDIAAKGLIFVGECRYVPGSVQISVGIDKKAKNRKISGMRE